MTAPASGAGRLIAALVAGQTGLHAGMAGLRMAAPLDVLQQGAAPLRVGVLMALFAAAPVALALAAGRMADRHGYHRPLRLAVALALAGLLLAAASTWAPAGARFALLAGGALAAGAGANIGLIAVQRTGGLAARDAVERMRMFSWLGIAPAMAGVIGPVAAGLLIDHGGFRIAYLVLLALPLLSLTVLRLVPVLAAPPRPAVRRAAFELLREPLLGRLLAVNWLLAVCWDVHSFAVPILGHGFGFSATTIGLVLGSFTLTVTAVRVVIPTLAHRLAEVQVLRAAMLGTGLVFALYPFARSPWAMAACAVVLGLTLGCVQPMIMTTLHHLTPPERHGEALALRSMAINASSTAMPLLFGALGAVAGAGVLFWLAGAAVVGATPLLRAFGGSSTP